MREERLIGTGMDGNASGSEKHGGKYDVTDDVLQAFKSGMSQIVLHEIPVFDPDNEPKWREYGCMNVINLSGLV